MFSLVYSVFIIYYIYHLPIFDESTFQKMLIPPSGYVNDYVEYILRKYAHLDGNNRTCKPWWEEVVQFL